MALFMQQVGCVEALNGDGGGSSTLYYKGAVLNANRSNERVVNHAVLIWFNDIVVEAPKPTEPVKEGDTVSDTTKYVNGTVDVKEGVWYTNGIKYAMENGHLSVNEKGEFKPNEPFTRAEFSNWLYRNRKLFNGVKE